MSKKVIFTLLTVLLIFTFNYKVQAFNFYEKNIKYAPVVDDNNNHEDEQDLIDEDKDAGYYDEVVNCTGIFSPELLDVLGEGYSWMKYIALMLTVVLSAVDFSRAIASQEQDVFKKVTKQFRTRLIILVIIFILPVIVNIVVSTFLGAEYSVCF